MRDSKRPSLSNFLKDREKIFVLLVALFTVFIIYIPGTKLSTAQPQNRVHAKAVVLSADNSMVQQFGIVKTGEQILEVRFLDGPWKGDVAEAQNQLVGKMELDKFFRPQDRVLAVVDADGGNIIDVTLIDRYRLDIEAALLGLFVLLVVAFAGWTGVKAILSFVFTAVMLWKVLLPGYLEGCDPLVLSAAVTAALTGVIIFLVAGFNRKGLVAFLGATAGLCLTCALSILFGRLFAVHGAVKPFAETLLYSGYPHLDLGKIFLSGIFIASSGAVMDLAMDVSASMNEIYLHRPELDLARGIRSGFQVGRAVIGTMTTTLLLAYFGGYSTMLMVFIGQGTPLVNILNLNYVAAEILHTLVGSFGLVAVAPLTAVIGGFFYTRGQEESTVKPRPAEQQKPAIRPGLRLEGRKS